MDERRLILCGGLPRPPGTAKENPVELALWGKNDNVTLKISDISRKIVANLPPLLADLMEIATYIYCADQATTRGGEDARTIGNKWRRDLDFHIPVRKPNVWSSSAVTPLLQDALGFLSDDNYNFTFQNLTDPPPVEQYFDFGVGGGTGFVPESVMLFSGGLDSLSGAVEEIIGKGHRVALVSHRSSPKIARHLKDLVADLEKSCSRPLLHVPVWIHKDKALGREYTQRSRSFLYASLGAVVARLFDLWEIKFFENGPVSLNLPICPQVIGGRATRTTHPRVIDGFAKIFSSVFGHEFKVENAFIWKTKTEIVESVAKAGCGGLIKNTISCTRTWERTRLKTHCGCCSQCIDRRFAVLAAGCAEMDPEEMYGVDLFVDERGPGLDRTMAESYVRTATEINKMDGSNGTDFFTKFPEANRAVTYLKNHGTVDEVASKVLDLHKRHAAAVCRVADEALAHHASDIREERLSPTCLLALTLPEKYKQRKPKKDPPKYPTPDGTCWETIRLRFLDGETLVVACNGGEGEKVSYEAIGMVDSRSHKPNSQWLLLRRFAQSHGELTWQSPGASRKNQKQREELAKKLISYFGIKEDPIRYMPALKSWKTRFDIQPES